MNEQAQAARRAAEERYHESQAERQEIARRRARDGTWVSDSDAQVEARVGRLFAMGQLPLEAIAAAVEGQQAGTRHVVYERIIDATNDLQPVQFLTRGARVVRTVARLEVRTPEGIAHGTGFLVSPRLLLTNHHVLRNHGDAARAIAEFNYELGDDDRPAMVSTYELDPDTLYLADEGLDYALVAVRPGDDGAPAGAVYGWNALLTTQGKAVIGDSLNVVGHPQGRLKHMAIRNGALANQLDDFLHYTTDTEPGSSGSPVYNDQWEVVALHHASVANPEAGAAGGQRRAPDAFVNEGARISVVLRHLREQPLSDAQRVLLRELSQPPPSLVPAVGDRADLPAAVSADTAPVGHPRRELTLVEGAAGAAEPLGPDVSGQMFVLPGVVLYRHSA